MPPETPGTSDATDPVPDDVSRTAILSAVREVRREGAKAAILHGTVDGLLVFFLVMVGLIVLGVGDVVSPILLDVPRSIVVTLDEWALVIPSRLALEAPVIVGSFAGVLVFGLEAGYLYRRATVERFEELNPDVREALRTARDAADDGAENPVANALYRDVIDALRDTSSRKFIGVKRLTVAIVLVSVLAVAVVGLSVSGISLGFWDGGGGFGFGPGGDAGGSGGGSDSILGDRADIDRGSVDRGIGLEGDENGSGGGSPGGAYDRGGFSVDPADVNAPAAEFTDEDRIEDADLIRDYNQRIREMEEAREDA